MTTTEDSTTTTGPAQPPGSALAARTTGGVPAVPDPSGGVAPARKWVAKAIRGRVDLDETQRDALIAALGGPDAVAGMDIVETFLPLDPESEALEALQAHLSDEGDGGLRLGDMDRVKMPSGGSTSFEVPDLEAEEGTSTARALEGIPLASERRRAMYLSAEVTGERPDCSSMDGVVPDPGMPMTSEGAGVETPGGKVLRNPEGTCESCPLSNYGSSFRSGSRGQQCTEARVIYLLQAGQVLPTVLRVPPTSLGIIRSFFLKVATGFSVPPHGVIVRFSLRKEKGGPSGGQEYAVLSPSVVRKLEPDEQLLAGVRALDFQTDLRGINQASLLTMEMMLDEDEGPGPDGDPVDEAPVDS